MQTINMKFAAFAMALSGALAVPALKPAVGGALDPSNNHHVEVQPAPEALQAVTVNIKNMLPGTPTLQAVFTHDEPGPGFGTNGAFGSELTFTIPVGAAGEVAIGKTSDVRNSKVEFNNGYNSSSTEIFLDVSYVDGFSLPINCGCGHGYVTGCRLALFAENKCQDQVAGPLCLNTAPANGPPLQFFAPCRDYAYTYSNQTGAGTGNYCNTGVINCCIGNECPGSGAA